MALPGLYREVRLLRISGLAAELLRPRERGGGAGGVELLRIRPRVGAQRGVVGYLVPVAIRILHPPGLSPSLRRTCVCGLGSERGRPCFSFIQVTVEDRRRAVFDQLFAFGDGVVQLGARDAGGIRNEPGDQPRRGITLRVRSLVRAEV